MFRWIGQSLQRKLTFILISSTIFPILLLGIYSVAISLKGYNQTITQNGHDILNQMEANLSYQLRDIERTSIFLIGLQEIQKYASTSQPTGEQQAIVLSVLTNLVSSKDHIFDISIYTINSPVVLSTSSLYSSELNSFVNVADVTEKMWTPPYLVTNYAGEQKIITFVRPLRSINNYKTLGWISISVNEQHLTETLMDYRLEGVSGEFYIVNEEQIILTSSLKERLGQSIMAYYPTIKFPFSEKIVSTFKDHDGKKIVLQTTDFYWNWSIVSLYSGQTLSPESSSILRFTTFTILISVIVTIVLILLTTRYVTNPLRLLTRLLSKINPDEPMPVYNSRSNDEIGHLAKSYSRLSQHIELLKQKVVRTEVRKKEADMRALQAQINPHFLYNTLSSVQWIALMEKSNRIADMVGALSDFLRFSLNKGNELCKIEHEIEHVRNYVMIQNIRYPDKFEVDIIIAPQLKQKLMLKLLLQPLVENAMIHGIQKLEGKGNITISIEEKDGMIHFIVADNGIGMSEERMHYIEEALQTVISDQPFADVYGLRNVNERLLLQYGKESRLHIKSSLNLGTQIYFTIP